MQKDFIDGALGTAEAVSIVERVVKRVADSVDELILFTQDTHGEDYLSTPEGKKLPVKHCIENTDGWKIDERILDAWRKNERTIRVSGPAENTFKKPVFGSVELLSFLPNLPEAAKIAEIELVGLCTDICVVSNAIMLKNFFPQVEISVNEACCAGVTPQSHREALNTMKMCQINII
jgi:nicotinamidase-related amidase